MAFNSLPSEVTQQVFLLIPRHELATCARVSRAWYTVITPLLYNQVDLVWRRPVSMCDRGMDTLLLDPCPCEEMGYCDYVRHLKAPVSGIRISRRHSHHFNTGCLAQPFGLERSFPSLYLLVRTLISTPSLARLLQYLRLTGSVPRSVWVDPEQTGLSHSDRKHVQSVLGSGSRISTSEWLRRLDSGDPIAFSALIIACVPALKYLELGADLQNALSFFSDDHISKSLPCLHTASIGVFDERVWMGRGRPPFYKSSEAPQLRTLCLPALQHLSLNIPSLPMDYLLSTIQQMPITPRLTSLTLGYTYLNEYGLYRLLLACPQLRSLKYDFWTRSPLEDPEDEQPGNMLTELDPSVDALVDMSILEQALRLVKNTLKILHLHIVSPRGKWNQLLRRISFHDFHHLATLHAPLQMLVNKQERGNGDVAKLHHSLPASLQELWLNDDGAVLWLNHSDFVNPYRMDWTLDNMWFGQTNHPIHTDEEIVRVVEDYLSGFHIHTPALRSLKLLFYFFDSPAWGQRDISMIRNALVPFNGHERVTVSVFELLKRSYKCQGGSDSLATNGQYPPYFQERSIEAATETDKYIREH